MLMKLVLEAAEQFKNKSQVLDYFHKGGVCVYVISTQWV